MAKRRTRKKAKGLGDTVEKVTKATGIEKAVKWLLGEDCGCDERKDKLNKLFPYKRPKCLTEGEHAWLTVWFSKPRVTVTGSEQRELLHIYNRVFNARRQKSNCGPCIKTVSGELKKVYDEYSAE